MFCSYGSPSSEPVSYDIGTCPVLHIEARISLWPVKGGSPIGMFLQWSEYLVVVSRFERPLNLHPELLSLIFNWTVGHVGAVVELLRMISYSVSLMSTPHCLTFLILLPRKYQMGAMGNRLRCKTFIMNIPFMSSYEALTGEPLDAAFLGISPIKQA